MVSDRRYVQWLDGTLEGYTSKNKKPYFEEGMWVRNQVLSAAWWGEGVLTEVLSEPLIVLLRHADSALPIMGKAYYRMYKIQEMLADPGFAPQLTAEQRPQVQQIHKDRWEWIHSDYHAAGYAPDPEYVGHDQHKDTEVMTGFWAVVARLYHGNSAKSMKALAQFMVYKNRTKGVFGETAVFAQASVMPAHEWWELYGSEVPELQYVAMKVLSKRSSACSVERLWSFFGQVWNDSRASLGAKKARDLVLAGSNIRLKNQLLGMELESDMRSQADPDMSDDEE